MKKIDITLYLVTDRLSDSEEVFLQKIEQACLGGVTLVQLREKEMEGREYLRLAEKVKVITDSFGIPLIIDDRIDIALAVDAAGVHVGQRDIPVKVARALLGADKIVGATAKTLERATIAWEEGADYLGVGAIFETTTKVKTVRTSVNTLNEICQSVPIPVAAIGGLNGSNMEVLDNSPIAGIAVASAIMKSSNPAAAAMEIKKRMIEMKGYRRI